MKILKKVILLTLVIMLCSLQTSFVRATIEEDVKITAEMKNYINGTNSIVSPMSLLDHQTKIDFSTWRSENIRLNRTNTDTGITVEVNNWGTHYVDAAIYTTDFRLIGSTKKALEGRTSFLTWPPLELKENPLSVYLFVTMYQEYYNPVTLTITY